MSLREKGPQLKLPIAVPSVGGQGSDIVSTFFKMRTPDKVDFQNGVYSYRKEFAPKGANSFLLELTRTEKEGKNSRAASPESIPSPL